MNVKQIATSLIALGCVAGVALAQETKPAPATTTGAKFDPNEKGAYTKKGTMEYGLAAGFSVNSAKQDAMPGLIPAVAVNSAEDSYLLNASGEISYYIINNLSVGLDVAVDYSHYDATESQTIPLLLGGKATITSDASTDLWLPSANAVVRYNFPVSTRIIPYVGVEGGGGWGWVDASASKKLTISGSLVPGANGTTVLATPGRIAPGNDWFWDYGAQAGFKVPLNERVLLDTCVKYTKYELPSSWNTSLDSWAVLMGLKVRM